MKDSNLRFPRSKQGGIAASPMRDKFGGGPGYRTLVVMSLARTHRRPRLPPNFGGNGWIRTSTLLRMKEVHDHYATLPYRNTLVSQSIAAIATLQVVSNLCIVFLGKLYDRAPQVLNTITCKDN